MSQAGRIVDAQTGTVVGPGLSVIGDIAVWADITGTELADSGIAFTTDGTLAANSDTLVPTEKAVKTYVDNANASQVVGPASATDNALVRFDGTTGKLVKNSVAILDNAGSLTGLTAVSVTGPTTMNGAQIVKRTTTAINYTVLATDFYLGVTDTSIPRTISLASAGLTANQTFTVKDESGGAAANNITIDVDGGLKTIDGAASVVLNGNYMSYNFIYDGANYFVW